ncbi:MAG: PD40 domain-containing protein [Thermoleophilaceae bacterium]|nr:PD40 domain-containing protein [Thermoleophilaceae bacterium]
MLIAAAALFCLAAAPPSSAQTRSACGVELSSGIPGTPGGPICGTDEGDDVVLSGEDDPIGFFGENGHDTVEGSRYADVLRGGPGNDEVHGGRGDDYIDGGDDSDRLFGGPGNDSIIERRFGVRERLYGGPGNDIVVGGRGNDYLYGNAGDDLLFGGPAGDRLFGGPGDDVLYGGPGRDVFDCGPGDDTVHRVRGQSGRDAPIPKEAGCERIINTDPTNASPLRLVRGGSGRDTLVGGDGPDLLEGKGGSDRLAGAGGDDELEGDGATNQGDDVLRGDEGDDRLAGRSGDDELYGGNGRDELAGGSGRDLLSGGPGDDLLFGAYDGDRILGGPGNDVTSLLGGDTSDPNGRVTVDCGPGFDIVVINPDRRGAFRNCESFREQFHEVDSAHLFRPSAEIFPPGLEALGGPGPGPPRSSRVARAASGKSRARRSQAPPPPGALPPADPNGGGSSPSISADGNRVAFSSDASNLMPDDVNGQRTDPFVRDLGAGQTLRAAARSGGAATTRGARFRRGPGQALTPDGRFAVFSSNSQDLGRRVEAYSIFRRDLARRVTEPACRLGNDDSESPVISADGRHVVFESRADNLGVSDQNQHTDVYWCDMGTGEVRRVSKPLDDSAGVGGSSLKPSVSADGRFVAFTSDTGGLLAGDGYRQGVYWQDVATGETRLVDVPAGAAGSDGIGDNPRISADGRFVVFDSDATDLPGGELNGTEVDVFRKDVTDGSLVLVSAAPNGGSANSSSTADSISADGNIVAFNSKANNLAEGDTNGFGDVFVRNISAGVTVRASVRADGGQLSGTSSSGALSADGRFVAFSSRAPDAGPRSSPSSRARIYRKDLVTGGVDPVMVGIDTPPISVLAEPAGTLLRRKVRLIAGTAGDNAGVSGVQVAISGRRRGKCVWLSRGTRLVQRPCDKPLYLRAKVVGGLRFTLRLRRLLPRGTYTMRSRAFDLTGQVEAASRTGENAVTFRLN